MDLSIFVPTDKEQQKEIVKHLKNQESLKIESERLIAKLEETGIDDIFFKLNTKKLIPFTQNIEINPHYDMPKSKESYNVLEMKDVDPYDGSIGNFTLKNNIKSTCKFNNNDIIFAKMTSGKKIKIAHVDCLDDNEVGFGSSEFLVFKSDETKILPEWVFFFCKSNYIKTRVKSTTHPNTLQYIKIDAR